jgi:hypothetical protein
MYLKKFLLLLPILLLTACSTTGKFTRLTPAQQPRNPDNMYPVEVAFNSSQQSVRWDSIKPFVTVDGQAYPLRPVPIMKNRWEGLVPVPPTQNALTYRFKFDYLYNSFGKQPQRDVALSPAYTLTIVGQ